MAGYSSTPLPTKLGIREGSRVAAVNAPSGFLAGDVLPAGASVDGGDEPELDVLVLFVTSASALLEQFTAEAQRLTPSGGLWVAWPKKSSGLPTDITESVLREILLPTGWVDNKVCAIDETWSGLRFVLRRALRHG
jgi:hypothetical protein